MTGKNCVRPTGIRRPNTFKLYAVSAALACSHETVTLVFLYRVVCHLVSIGLVLTLIYIAAQCFYTAIQLCSLNNVKHNVFFAVCGAQPLYVGLQL